MLSHGIYSMKIKKSICQYVNMQSYGEFFLLKKTLDKSLGLSYKKSVRSEPYEREYCQEFCVKLLSASFLKYGRLLGTFPMGFDLQFNSILRHINARSM